MIMQWPCLLVKHGHDSKHVINTTILIHNDKVDKFITRGFSSTIPFNNSTVWRECFTRDEFDANKTLKIEPPYISPPSPSTTFSSNLGLDRLFPLHSLLFSTRKSERQVIGKHIINFYLFNIVLLYSMSKVSNKHGKDNNNNNNNIFISHDIIDSKKNQSYHSETRQLAVQLIITRK